MKRISLFALVGLLSVTTSCSDSNSSMSETATPEGVEWAANVPTLSGNVESVEITAYTLKDSFGETVTDKVKGKQIYKFDQQGNVVESALYKSDGSLNRKEADKYDSQGNKIEEAWYNSDGSLDWKYLYKYDSQGNKIEEAKYKSDGSLDYKYLYKYDSLGNQIERASYRSNGSLGIKILYKYDSQGNLIEQITYKGDVMTPIEKTEFKITYRK